MVLVPYLVIISEIKSVQLWKEERTYEKLPENTKRQN